MRSTVGSQLALTATPSVDPMRSSPLRLSIPVVLTAWGCISTSSTLAADRVKPLAASQAINRAVAKAADTCAAERTALQGVHPAAAAAIGTTTIRRIELAAQAHGRGVLAWQADLQDQILATDKSMHPTRRALFTASSTYLRCRHAALPQLPDWQPSRDESVPALWAFPGDILFTQNGDCAVFLRGEAAGQPGPGYGEFDRVAWQWSGTCRNGMAEGRGKARLVLRSGETRPGLMGQPFEEASFVEGRMQGLFHVTDDKRSDPAWRQHFERYSNGRVVSRVREEPNGTLLAIKYVKAGDDWGWEPAKTGR